MRNTPRFPFGEEEAAFQKALSEMANNHEANQEAARDAALSYLMQKAPVYGVFLFRNGKLHGIVERGVSATAVGHVRVFVTGSEPYWPEKFFDGYADAKRLADSNPHYILIDLLSDDCPVDIDWVRWHQGQSESDYFRCNAPFTVNHIRGLEEKLLSSTVAQLCEAKEKAAQERDTAIRAATVKHTEAYVDTVRPIDAELDAVIEKYEDKAWALFRESCAGGEIVVLREHTQINAVGEGINVKFKYRKWVGQTLQDMVYAGSTIIPWEDLME